MTERLLSIMPASRRKAVQTLLRDRTIRAGQFLKILDSDRKKARGILADALGIPASSLRLKREAVEPESPIAGSKIPLADLFLRYYGEGKENEFQTLRRLVYVNKEMKNAFQDFLNRIRDRIKAVVSLCHFFDLTRKYPKNDFQPLVGVSFILDTDSGGRAEHKINLENNRFVWTTHSYDTRRVEHHRFPNTKEGFVQLLDQFIPVFKSCVIAPNLEPHWRFMLRPLTAWDRQMLRRFRLIQDDTKAGGFNPLENIVFKVNDQTISHWDMSYLDNVDDWYD